MSTISFAGKVAIITGAGHGLGRAYARELARRGAKVVVNDLGGPVKSGGGSREVAENPGAGNPRPGGTAVPTYESGLHTARRRGDRECALDAFGRVDVLIGNAGNLRCMALDEIREDDRDSLHSTHLNCQFNVRSPLLHGRDVRAVVMHDDCHAMRIVFEVRARIAVLALQENARR